MLFAKILVRAYEIVLALRPRSATGLIKPAALTHISGARKTKVTTLAAAAGRA